MRRNRLVGNGTHQGEETLATGPKAGPENQWMLNFIPSPTLQIPYPIDREQDSNGTEC